MKNTLTLLLIASGLTIGSGISNQHLNSNIISNIAANNVSFSFGSQNVYNNGGTAKQISNSNFLTNRINNNQFVEYNISTLKPVNSGIIAGLMINNSGDLTLNLKQVDRSKIAKTVTDDMIKEDYAIVNSTKTIITTNDSFHSNNAFNRTAYFDSSKKLFSNDWTYLKFGGLEKTIILSGPFAKFINKGQPINSQYGLYYIAQAARGHNPTIAVNDDIILATNFLNQVLPNNKTNNKIASTIIPDLIKNDLGFNLWANAPYGNDTPYFATHLILDHEQHIVELGYDRYNYDQSLTNKIQFGTVYSTTVNINYQDLWYIKNDPNYNAVETYINKNFNQSQWSSANNLAHICVDNINHIIQHTSGKGTIILLANLVPEFGNNWIYNGSEVW